jgi:outer membrane receptor protein involved in Fe transport
MGSSLESYVRFTVQYVGSSFTQLGDEEPNFGLISGLDPRPGGSARLIDLGNVDVTNIEFDPELPSYAIGNLRWGVTSDKWEAALYVNNLWDERAFLSVDRERGRSARVGYLTNAPRTYGVNFRVNF